VQRRIIVQDKRLKFQQHPFSFLGTAPPLPKFTAPFCGAAPVEEACLEVVGFATLDCATLFLISLVMRVKAYSTLLLTLAEVSRKRTP
jgi:hypothetical protein